MMYSKNEYTGGVFSRIFCFIRFAYTNEQEIITFCSDSYD